VNTWRLLVPVGVLAAAAGTVFVLRPGLAPPVPLATLFVLGVWAVGLVGTGLAVLGRLTDPGPEAGRLPTAGDRPPYPVPGDDLADRTASVGASERDAAERDRIRERVRDAAAAVLVRCDGLSDAEARARVDAGDWTDDDEAASLFADEGRRDGVETGFAPRVERATAAVADRFAASRPATDGADESTDDTTDSAAGSPPGDDRVTLDLAPAGERLERTGRWRGVQGLALLVTAVGILVGAPLVILTGVVGVAFAAYARVWDAPAPALAVERAVSESAPRPGERVEVTLSMRNRGDRMLPDLRVCDDVPPGLRVVDGSPRHTTALRPGKTATVSYTVEAVRGEHEFDSLAVVTRDISGASRRAARLPTESVTVTCRPAYGEHAVGLGELATLLAGRTDAAETGSGVAFHSLREYRRGDPLGRLDWGHLAKTGEFATRRFDEHRLVRVVLLVDARAAASVTADRRHRRPAVDVCATAAGALGTGLLDDGALVGLAALGPRPCWVPPGSGRDHRERLLDALTAHAAFDWDPPEGAPVDAPAERADPEPVVSVSHVVRSAAASEDGGVSIDDAPAGGRSVAISDGGASAEEGTSPDETPREEGDDRDPAETAKALLDDVVTRLPVDAQVVFCSPLADDAAAAVARQLDARGHDVLVASPDVTGGATPYRRLAGVERRLRLDGLRRSGVAVHEWTPPVEATADAGWSP
jgi:uncharacterized repeat protein (TIGR01451 family)